MRVRNSADGGEGFVKDEMGRQIGRRTKIAFDGLAIEIDDDEVFGLHGVVGNATGFDDDKAVLARNAAGVAKGKKNEAAANEFEIGLQNVIAKRFEFHALPLLFSNLSRFSSGAKESLSG
jgi:hypothetical protein